MDENNSAPILSPEQAQQLQDSGALTPETASSFFTTPEIGAIPVTQPDPVEQEKALLQQETDLTAASAFTPSGFPTNTTGAAGEVTDSEALASLAEKQQAQDVANQEAQAAELVRQNQVLAQYQQDKANAAAAGVAIPANPEAEALLNQQEIAAQGELDSASAQDFAVPGQENVAPEQVVDAAESGIRNIAAEASAAGANLLNEANGAIDKIYEDAQNSKETAEANRIKRQADLQAKQDAVGKEIDEIEAEYKTALQDVDDSADKTIYSDKGTGQSILAGLAIFMSGLGEGLQGRGGNPVLNMLTKRLEQDTKNAQFKATRLGKTLKDKQTLYDAYYDRFKDADQAYNATMAAHYKEMQAKLSVVGQKFNNAQSVQNQQLAAQEIQRKMDEHRQKAVGNSTLQHMIANSSKYTPQDFILAGGDEGKKVSLNLVPGYGLAGSPEGAKETKAFSAVAENVEQGVNELLEMTKGGLVTDFSPSQRARANTIAAMLVGELRLPIVGPGAVSERELELLNSIIANPTRVNSLGISERSALQTLNRRIRDKFNLKLKSEGLAIPKTTPSTFRPEK